MPGYDIDAFVSNYYEMRRTYGDYATSHRALFAFFVTSHCEMVDGTLNDELTVFRDLDRRNIAFQKAFIAELLRRSRHEILPISKTDEEFVSEWEGDVRHQLVSRCLSGRVFRRATQDLVMAYLWNPQRFEAMCDEHFVKPGQMQNVIRVQRIVRSLLRVYDWAEAWTEQWKSDNPVNRY